MRTIKSHILVRIGGDVAVSQIGWECGGQWVVIWRSLRPGGDVWEGSGWEKAGGGRMGEGKTREGCIKLKVNVLNKTGWGFGGQSERAGILRSVRL